jgi:hypothetical protein
VKKLNHKSGEQEDQFYLKFSSESFCGCEHFVALAEKTYERRGRAMTSSEPQIFLPGHLEKAQASINSMALKPTSINQYGANESF